MTVSKEEMEKALMQQIYGVGHGISSYPSGVATANPFLHPAMFSASTGESKIHINIPDFLVGESSSKPLLLYGSVELWLRWHARKGGRINYDFPTFCWC